MSMQILKLTRIDGRHVYIPVSTLGPFYRSMEDSHNVDDETGEEWTNPGQTTILYGHAHQALEVQETPEFILRLIEGEISSVDQEILHELSLPDSEWKKRAESVRHLLHESGYLKADGSQTVVECLEEMIQQLDMVQLAVTPTSQKELPLNG